MTVDDVDVACLYDPFTISPLMQLEAYGFCGPGEGGPFVAAGETGLAGKIPTNTGGGQLSGYYATGFTAVVEGILQMRGDGGATQVADAEVALVSGHGGNAASRTRGCTPPSFSGRTGDAAAAAGHRRGRAR